MEEIVLRPGQVHFFYTQVNDLKDPGLLDIYRNISSEKEKTKTDRYRFEKDRHKCLVTRGLQRFILSRYTGIPPHSLEFEENTHGKPCIKPGLVPIPIQFNLSHAGTLTAIAVVLHHPMGIDLEDRNRKVDLKIADRFFSPQECEQLHHAGENEKKALFFDFWTLKESYIKAKGRGLSIPLNKFSFFIDKTRTSIGFEDSYPDDPDNFTFFRFGLLNKFKAAVTIESASHPISALTVYECIPFEKIKKQTSILQSGEFPPEIIFKA